MTRHNVQINSATFSLRGKNKHERKWEQILYKSFTWHRWYEYMVRLESNVIDLNYLWVLVRINDFQQYTRPFCIVVDYFTTSVSSHK